MDFLCVQFQFTTKQAFSLIYEAEYEIQLYFFDNQIYITDEIKLIYLSHNGNIIWIYWHFDSIDFIDFVEKNNYLSLHSSNEITEIDRNTGGILKSKQ